MSGRDDPPPRVRVTAAASGRRAPAVTRGIALPGTPAQEADAAFARGLMRSQLRLALGILAGFVVVAGALGALLALSTELHDIVLWGVPLSWLLHAYGFYPVIFVFALVYLIAAARNERRYKALRSTE